MTSSYVCIVFVIVYEISTPETFSFMENIKFAINTSIYDFTVHNNYGGSLFCHRLSKLRSEILSRLSMARGVRMKDYLSKFPLLVWC